MFTNHDTSSSYPLFVNLVTKHINRKYLLVFDEQAGDGSVYPDHDVSRYHDGPPHRDHGPPHRDHGPPPHRDHGPPPHHRDGFHQRDSEPHPPHRERPYGMRKERKTFCHKDLINANLLAIAIQIRVSAVPGKWATWAIRAAWAWTVLDPDSTVLQEAWVVARHADRRPAARRTSRAGITYGVFAVWKAVASSYTRATATTTVHRCLKNTILWTKNDYSNNSKILFTTSIHVLHHSCR